jgi:hypothetical protein
MSPLHSSLFVSVFAGLIKACCDVTGGKVYKYGVLFGCIYGCASVVVNEAAGCEFGSIKLSVFLHAGEDFCVLIFAVLPR